MNYCINCGEKRKNNSRYCSNCGLGFEISNESGFDIIQKEDEQLLSGIIVEKVENEIPLSDPSNDVFLKILVFFENINGKKLFVYNLCAYILNYSIGYFLASKFGVTLNLFFTLLFLDFIIGGVGYWFRSKQFPNGRLIFCIWTIGLLIFDTTQVNAILFDFSILTEYKYLYVLFLTPASWYMILKNNPNARASETND